MQEEDSPLSNGDGIGRMESNHGGLHTTFGRTFGDVVVDGAQNIRINVITHGGIDQNLVAVTKESSVLSRRALFKKLPGPT